MPFTALLVDAADTNLVSRVVHSALDIIITITRLTLAGNVYVLKGQADFYQGASTGFIKSPHFPLPYPSDYSVEYQLVNTDPRGFVQLVFTDFQLSPWSYIEVSRNSIGRL